MRKALRAVLFLLLAAAALALLLHAEGVRGAVGEGLELCFSAILPSLFPFFVLTSLLTSLGFPEAAARLLAPWMEALFHLSGNGASALALGFLGGYPAGARSAAQLYTKGLCSRQETEQLLAFCNNCGPAFLLSFVGEGIFGSLRRGAWLWLIHVLAALLSGIALRPRAKERLSAFRRFPLPVTPFSAAFVEAVQSGFSAFLSVCGFVLLFSVLLRPLRLLCPGPLAMGFAELFSGVSYLAPTRGDFILAAAMVGWGGLSVHAQSLAFLLPAGLSCRRYFLGKALQALLSGLLAALYVRFLW